MDSHSTVEEPPQERSSHFYNLLGGLIAVLTLTLPFYITSHYSSSTALSNTSPSTTTEAAAPR
ncbi:MAG TPA: hypothetical protein V6D19_16730 [Stenomitos sp.]